MQVSTKLCVVKRENKVLPESEREREWEKRATVKKSIFQNAMRRNQTDIEGKFMCVYLPFQPVMERTNEQILSIRSASQRRRMCVCVCE